MTIHEYIPRKLVVGNQQLVKKKVTGSTKFNIIANFFSETKMFIQTMFFYSNFAYNTRGHISLTQAVIFSSTSNIISSPLLPRFAITCDS